MIRSLFMVLLVATAAARSVAQQTSPATAATIAPPVQNDAIEWHRSQLASGVRLIIVHVPTAKNQTTFSFLPLNLANDDADRAQWAHLLEHMLIRTTDAEGLQADGMIFNGETTDGYLRLETFAEPAHWRESLDRHARWLTARAFDPARLEHEKGMIATEEQSTAEKGFTDKFAVAAWNQVFTCGRDQANVHGDVQRAKAEDIAAYTAAKIRFDSTLLIASIGPTPIEDVRAEITRLLGDTKPVPKTVLPAANAQEPPARRPQTLQATWDLPTRHVLWCWPLPDHRPQSLAAATAVTRALAMRVRSRKELSRAIRSMNAHAAVTTQQGTYMLLDACITADAEAEDLTGIIRGCAAALCDRTSPSATQSIVFAGRLAAQEFMIEPQFDKLAAQVPAQMRDNVEGLWLLSQLNYEYVWGLTAAEVQPMLMTQDEQAVAEVVSRLRSEPVTVILEPLAQAKP